MPHETAAVLVRSVCTTQPCTMSHHFIQSHISRGEQTSATLAGTWTWDLLIISLLLYHWAILAPQWYTVHYINQPNSNYFPPREIMSLSLRKAIHDRAACYLFTSPSDNFHTSHITSFKNLFLSSHSLALAAIFAFSCAIWSCNQRNESKWDWK